MCRDENLQVEIIISSCSQSILVLFPINLLDRGVYFPPAVADFNKLLAFPYANFVKYKLTSTASSDAAAFSTSL